MMFFHKIVSTNSTEAADKILLKITPKTPNRGIKRKIDTMSIIFGIFQRYSNFLGVFVNFEPTADPKISCGIVNAAEIANT